MFSSDPLPASPPPAVLADIEHAAATAERLDRHGLSVRFSLPGPDGARVGAQLVSRHPFEPPRPLTPGEVLALADG